MIRKKILLIGDFNVGKTSLIRRYVDNAFNDDYLTTIGVKISKKALNIDNREGELLIWDIEGATASKRIPTSYFRGASGAVFVADVSRAESMTHLEEHIESFLSVNPTAEYVIAYNKSDLLSDEEREALHRGDDTFLTSAKDDTDVEILFTTLARGVLR